MQIQSLLHFIIVALYMVIGGFAWRHLYPSLPRTSKALATVFLVLFAALTVWSELHHKSPNSFRMVWDIAWEGGIPTRVQAVQLALIGAISLLNALLAWRRNRLATVYFLMLAAAFGFLSYEEYFFNYFFGWHEVYALAGALLVLLLLVITKVMSSGGGQWVRQRGLLVCIPAGLVIGALGALGLDSIEVQISAWAQSSWGQQLKTSPLEESLEFLGMWLALAAMLGLSAAQKPPRWLGALAAAFALAGLLAAFALPVFPEEPQGYIVKTKVQFEGDIQLRGYTIQHVDEGRKVQVHTHLSPGPAGFTGLGYSIVLIDQASRAALSTDDNRADANLDSWLTADFRTVYRQWTDLDIPPAPAESRALWLALALWRDVDGQYLPLQILSSELQTLGDSHVLLDEFVLRGAAQNPPRSDYLARFDNVFTLERAELPERANIGEPLSAHFAWRADVDGEDDFIQLLHLQHSDSGQIFAFDQPPLGARLPTRLWFGGLAEAETWHAPLPADMPPGRYRVLTGLYHSSSIERVPAINAAGAQFQDMLVPLGDVLLENVATP